MHIINRIEVSATSEDQAVNARAARKQWFFQLLHAQARTFRLRGTWRCRS